MNWQALGEEAIYNGAAPELVVGVIRIIHDALWQELSGESRLSEKLNTARCERLLVLMAATPKAVWGEIAERYLEVVVRSRKPLVYRLPPDPLVKVEHYPIVEEPIIEEVADNEHRTQDNVTNSFAGLFQA